MNIADYIRTVPDYPVPGVNFYDMNSLFASPIWNEVAYNLTELVHNSDTGFITHIAGIESRGFVVGTAVAYELAKPMVMIRKKGSKYPGKLLEETYELEYGTDTLVLQEGILGHTSRVLIMDDLVATGGSVIATKKLIEQTGATVVGCATLVNLKYLNTSELGDIKMLSMYNALRQEGTW